MTETEQDEVEFAMIRAWCKANHNATEREISDAEYRIHKLIERTCTPTNTVQQ